MSSEILSLRAIRRFAKQADLTETLNHAFAGDSDAAIEFALSLMRSGADDKVRAWFLGEINKRFGPSPTTLAVLKMVWYGAHDYIGLLLGANRLREIGKFDQSISELPNTFFIYRAEWEKPNGFLSPVASWARSRRQAEAYLSKCRILVERQIVDLH